MLSQHVGDPCATQMSFKVWSSLVTWCSNQVVKLSYKSSSEDAVLYTGQFSSVHFDLITQEMAPGSGYCKF